MLLPRNFYKDAHAPLRLRSRSVASRFAPRILMGFFSLLLLAGCGFHPMYGDNSMGTAGSAIRGNIKIDPMPGREGQILKKALEDLFNPEGLDTTNAEYHLNISMVRTLYCPRSSKATAPSSATMCASIQTYTLYKFGQKKPVDSGKMRRTGSYNVAVNANFATYEAEQDVIDKRLLRGYGGRLCHACLGHPGREAYPCRARQMKLATRDIAGFMRAPDAQAMAVLAIWA